jgi:diguanylate cyclase
MLAADSGRAIFLRRRRMGPPKLWAGIRDVSPERVTAGLSAISNQETLIPRRSAAWNDPVPARVPLPDGHGVDGQRIDALIAEASSVDAGFEEHALVVSALSLRVGHELQLAAGELELLEFAAAVHDVGKLSVAPSIITKPGPMDEEEWKEMRRHPDAGADLLGPCAAPAEVLDIVRSHHEHWDGNGYPRGLKGDEIPLAARIISAADAYCAMIEARPYRPPMRPAAARAELLAQAGTQFDADCARATYRVTAATG